MARRRRHGRSIGCRFTEMGNEVRRALVVPGMENPARYCQQMAEFARLDPCDHLDCQPCAAKPTDARCGSCRTAPGGNVEVERHG